MMTARGRNRGSKASVQKGEARLRKLQESDAQTIDEAIAVIEQRFNSERRTVDRLAFLAEMIRQGDTNYTDFLVG
jgi:hypothetical protein